MKNAIYSLLLSTIIVPALLVVPPQQANEPARNQSDWPVIDVVQTPVEPVEVVSEPVEKSEGMAAAYEMKSSIDEQAKALEKLADEIRTIAGKVQADADRAKQSADEAKKNADLASKNFEGMKSYVPPVADIHPLTEARVIELIDQRIKELNIECKCVVTGKTEVRKVSTVMDSRGVAAFDVPPGAVLTGYQDVNTGKWVTVNRDQMKAVATSPNGSPVVGYSSQTTEYREIVQPERSKPVRAAVQFFQGGNQTCRYETINGVRTRVCN